MRERAEDVTQRRSDFGATSGRLRRALSVER